MQLVILTRPSACFLLSRPAVLLRLPLDRNLICTSHAFKAHVRSSRVFSCGSAQSDSSDEYASNNSTSTDDPSVINRVRTIKLENSTTSNYLNTARSEFSNSVPTSISGPVALVLLNFVTILWGSQHAVIKMALESGDGMSPATLNLDRFILAAILFIPFAPRLDLASIVSGSASMEDRGAVPSPVKAGATETWRTGFELAAWMFAGYAMQAVSGFTVFLFRHLSLALNKSRAALTDCIGSLIRGGACIHHWSLWAREGVSPPRCAAVILARQQRPPPPPPPRAAGPRPHPSLP